MKQVTAAIIVESGRVLLARRALNQKLAGFWEFPGGKVEPGETLQACLERELLEELSLKCKAGEELIRTEYIYDHGIFNLIAFATTIISGRIELSVHDQFKWVAINELLAYQLAPADIPIARWIQGEPSYADK